MPYNTAHKATLKHLKALAQRTQAAIEGIPTETWTFVLEDDTEVTKEVAVWTSGT